MKGIDGLRTALERRLDQSWHLTLAGDDSFWPCTVPLGRTASGSIDQNFAAVQAWVFEWRDWARSAGVTLVDSPRRIGGTMERIPTQAIVPDVDTAARIVAGAWPRRLKRGRQRLERLRAAFPEHAQPERVLRAGQGYSDVDFDLLLTAAAWFQQHHGEGLSPRQVPVEGLHGKWLNSHRGPVADLAGVEDLGVVEVRAPEVHFTYLDPTYRAGTGRTHDSAVPGDQVTPAYLPDLVIISENKDTAILFPLTPRAISVQGHGDAGPVLISQIPFLAQAPRIVYWGDLDARGLVIVDGYRKAGMAVETILMDVPTLVRYARFAATTDERGKPLTRRPRRPLQHLTPAEAAVYDALTDPASDLPIRVEQERIPLYVAAQEIRRLGIGSGNGSH